MAVEEELDADIDAGGETIRFGSRATTVTAVPIINPYDAEDFADALARAIDMPKHERRARMAAMRRVVAGRNVFSWASDILEGLESLWTKPLLYAAHAPEETPV